MTKWDAETALLRDEVRRTRVGAAVGAVTAAVERAWQGSSARRVVDRLTGVVRAASLTDRVRAFGIWASAAAIVDGLLTPFDPQPATVSRWTLWAGVLGIGATAAAFAEPVAAAWTEWRARWFR